MKILLRQASKPSPCTGPLLAPTRVLASSFSPRLGGALACALVCNLSGALGCSSYRPPTADSLIQRQLAEILPQEFQGQVALPFEVSERILADVGSRVNPSASEKERGQALTDYIFGRLKLRYSSQPTRNAEEVFVSHEANCLSFVNLFVGIGRQRRLNPFYVEVEDYQRWSYQNGTVLSRGHIVAGMYLDGQLSTYDFLPYRPKSYRSFKPVTDIVATAHYYNNVGAEALLDDRIEDAEVALRIALALAPDFEKALNNFGVLLLRQGESQRAVTHYQRAEGLHPDSVPILGNLARAYQQVGRAAEAEQIFVRMETLNLRNPYFFVYRGELALSAGNPARALELMREAWRVDDELPEVHVGLAKVYLDLGRLEEAREHVKRALRLDATNLEALRYAGLLEQGRGLSE